MAASDLDRRAEERSKKTAHLRHRMVEAHEGGHHRPQSSLRSHPQSCFYLQLQPCTQKVVGQWLHGLQHADRAGALSEIDYVFNSLQAIGVNLFTSYGGPDLGSKAFQPIRAELDKIHEVVHVHPNHSFAAPFTIPY